MIDYDFRTLNDKEFEVFCADLLGAANGVRIERFKAGRDGGVDGRFYVSPKQEVILQCKHWANTPTSQLIIHLAKEKARLDKLKPARYLVAVSNPLSHADKKAISAELGEHLKSDSDIFGKEDLNDLLKQYPELERRHYKLWLSSSGVISHILNMPIYDRSAYCLREALAAGKKYVTTENHDKALSKLESLGVVILSGEPGIGKTTLAEHLCLHYVGEGYEFYKIEGDVREAEGVFQEKKKQVFYFDDFLGRNYFEALSGQAGSKVIGFIRRVVSERGCKRFILTSRSTVLNQGKALMDCFEHQNLDRNEFEITVATLREMDKARILYNHIWHSDLPPEYVEQLYLAKRYRRVIQHRNFNPRLINFVTDYTRLQEVSAKDYWSQIVSTLDNPSDVWENPFLVQQDDYGRAITLLVTLNGKPISEEALSQAYKAYLSFPPHLGMQGRRDFMMNLKHLCGSLLSRRFQEDGRVKLDLFNPSLGDYVLRRCTRDISELRLGLLSLRTVSSLQTLISLFANNMISRESLRETVEAIVCHAMENKLVGYGPAYIAKAAMNLGMFGEVDKFANDIKLVLAFLEQEKSPDNYEDVVRVALLAAKKGWMASSEVCRWVQSACSVGVDYSSVRALGELVAYLDLSDEAGSAAKKRYDAAVVGFVTDSLEEEANDSDIFSGVAYEDDDAARGKVESLVQKLMDGYGVPASAYSVSDVMKHFDYSQALLDYYEKGYDGSDERISSGYVQGADGIDDLFERT